MMLFSLPRVALAAGLILVSLTGPRVFAAATDQPGPNYQLFAHNHRMAWCIVPFDSQKREPEVQEGLLARLGFQPFG